MLDELERTFTARAGSAADVEVVAESASGFDVEFQFTGPESVASLQAPAGATWEVQPDGSAILTDPQAPVGTVGGLVMDPGADDAGAKVRVLLSSQPEADVVQLGLRPRQTTEYPVTARATVVLRALERATWAEDLEGGRSLQVVPSKWGRSGSSGAREAVWRSTIALEPAADTDVMGYQLRCHALGAPEKASWNLEPWRPDVSYLEYVLAKCNPTK